MATCIITGTICTSDGQPLVGALVYAVPATSPAISSTGFAISPMPLQTCTSTGGVFYLTLIQDIDFVVTIPTLGYREKIIVPAQTTYDLFNLGILPIDNEPDPTPAPPEPNW